jgi:hypothetical protein
MSAVEIYISRTKAFRSRIGDVGFTGHRIEEDSGQFTVYSILPGVELLCRGVLRHHAEEAIELEWREFVARRKPDTIRELLKRYDTLRFDQRNAEYNLRNALAEVRLRSLLRPGDKLRATKASCGARESTLQFSRWDGRWILSKSRASVAPGSVFSVNGEVIRV